MIDIKVEAGQVDKMLARFRGADILSAAFQRIQRPLQEELMREPAQRRAKQPFKTAKQRRFFFFALRSGRITVPYRRTGRLKQGWKARFALSGSTVTFNLSNTAPKANKVIGDDPYSYHKGHWTPASKTVKKYTPLIQQVIGEEIRRRH